MAQFDDERKPKVDAFFAGLDGRVQAVKQRCLRDLQALADALVAMTAEAAT